MPDLAHTVVRIQSDLEELWADLIEPGIALKSLFVVRFIDSGGRPLPVGFELEEPRVLSESAA